MLRNVQPIGTWLLTLVLIALMVGALGLRSAAETATPAAETATPATEPAPSASVVVASWPDFPGRDVSIDVDSLPQQAPPPATPMAATEAPTPRPPPPPTPVPATQPPPAPAQPPPDDRSGGGLAPRTAPPGWTPPPITPGDILTTGAFGQTLSAGGITVTASRLPLDVDVSGCDDGNPVPDGLMWVGFSVTTTWSGFDLPAYGASAPNQGLVTCWLGSPSPLVSGVTYQVFLQLPPGSAATTSLKTGYFPNGFSPAYIFAFD